MTSIALTVILLCGSLQTDYSLDATHQEVEDFSEFVVAPSPEHQLLRDDVGAWEATIRSYSPGIAEPMTSKGVEHCRMFGELWLTSEFEGTFAGFPFSGRGQTGFDPTSGKYVSTWIDTISPSMLTMEGTFDKESKTLTFVGKSVDPETGQKVSTKVVQRYIDENHKSFKMLMEVPGSTDGFATFMEIDYVRKSDAQSSEK